MQSGPYTARDVATAYNFPMTSQGNGQCIGIIELGGSYYPSDSQTFFSSLNLPVPQVVEINVDGGAPSNADGDQEVALDIQVAGAVAPQARLAVYFAPNTTQAFLDAIQTAIDDGMNQPSVISISWGAQEDQFTQAEIDAFDLAFQNAATLGVTVLAVSGDNGSSDGETDGLAHVHFPASDPYVLGCGGTQLIANGATIVSETVWNNNSRATGGGVSDKFPLPSWQASAGVPPSVNPGHKVGRGVPDVAGDADPTTGYNCIINGQSEVVGGTSAVAPLFAGLIALINSAGTRSLGVGYITPILYPARRRVSGHQERRKRGL
jgi:kumamolisin